MSAKIFSQTINVIPAIKNIVMAKGSFVVNEKTSIKFRESFKAEAEAFRMMIKNIYGIVLQLNNDAKDNVIEIENKLLINELEVGNDFYQITVTPKGIAVGGINNQGTFCGMMTILQLMNKKNEIPCCAISDQEDNYIWRGMHLDVSRHFFPKEFIKKYLDLLAIHKMNTFHWHLTDDQGWRIEIKKYPKLTTVGAWRKGSMVGSYNKQRFDTITYGGFYTQEDIKEIIAYASARQITVIPEIEMPGHSVAALTAYPLLACKDTTFSVAKGWGVFDDVYCTKEETFVFLQDVLSEVADLFPGKYIHIGGDECPKTRWKACARCKDRMKKENLKDENELQSYFIKRIEKFLNLKGKQIIGWDEILDGGIAPNATVMSWRGTEGGEAAAKQNHNVVMTPGTHCYFDHYQGLSEFEPTAIGGFTTTEKVYSYNPMPEFISADKQKYILGAQGNIWTEYINSPQDVEYMALPRLCALAEVLWCNKETLNWNNFTQRMASHFLLLDKMKCNYAKSIYDVRYLTQPSKSLDGYEIVLNSEAAGTIFYTIDGTDPTNKSLIYKTPFELGKTTTVKAGLFIEEKISGKILTKEFIISFASGKKTIFNNKPSEYYKKNGSFALVNGILESASVGRENCIGWCNDDANLTVDLGAAKSVKKVTLYFLQDAINFIVQPKSVTVYFSTDGSRFQIAGKAKFSYSGKNYMKIELNFEPFTSSLVKIRAENPGKITAEKISHNKDLWLLLDEVVIE